MSDRPLIIGLFTDLRKIPTHTHYGRDLKEAPGWAVQGRPGPDRVGSSNKKANAEAPGRPRIPRKDVLKILGILGLPGASALVFPLGFAEVPGKQVGSSGLQASWNG